MGSIIRKSSKKVFKKKQYKSPGTKPFFKVEHVNNETENELKKIFDDNTTCIIHDSGQIHTELKRYRAYTPSRIFDPAVYELLKIQSVRESFSMNNSNNENTL